MKNRRPVGICHNGKEATEKADLGVDIRSALSPEADRLQLLQCKLVNTRPVGISTKTYLKQFT